MKIHRVDLDMALVINQNATTNSHQTQDAMLGSGTLLAIENYVGLLFELLQLYFLLLCSWRGKSLYPVRGGTFYPTYLQTKGFLEIIYYLLGTGSPMTLVFCTSTSPSACLIM